MWSLWSWGAVEVTMGSLPWGNHGCVISMISRDGAGATLAPCSLGMVLAPRSPRMKLVQDVWHWGETFRNEVIPI